jgi:6-phosphogluconolactonase (cycloisomerase 2 family)
MDSTRPRPLSIATARALSLALCASWILLGCGNGLDGAGATIGTGNGGTGGIGGSSSSSSSSGGPQQSYTIGGNTIGLSGSGLVLLNNGGDNLTITGNGGFTFSNREPSGGAYSVAVLTQPTNPTQTCTVQDGVGTVGTVNVASIIVSCTTNFYTVGGSVSGLIGSGLVVQTNGSNNFPVASNGNYTFSTLASGTPYTVTVMTQPTNPSQTCTVANDTGTIGAANVTNVAITCTTNQYTVSGTVSGLTGSGLVLQTNGGGNLPIASSGSYTFATLPSGSAYAVTVLTQPSAPAQWCMVSNGTGTITFADITNVTVTCRTTGKFVFVSNTFDNPNGGATLRGSLSAFTIDPNTGALTAVAGSSPLAAPNTHPEGIAVDPSGLYIYVTDNYNATVDTYSVNPGSGALAPFSSASTGTATNLPYSIAIDPAGAHVYVGSFDGPPSAIEAYDVNAGILASIVAAPAPPYAVGSPLGLAVDPNDQFVFATDTYNSALSVFSVGSGGTLTPVTGSPFPFQAGYPTNAAYAIAVYPSGGFFYVTDFAANTATAYSYAADGTLAELATPLAVGVKPESVAVDPSGRFLYVANTGDGTSAPGSVTALSIDAGTGQLNPVAIGTYPTGGGLTYSTVAVQVDPSGQFVYVANGDGATVSAFKINQITGALTAIGSPLATGSGSQGIAVE